MSAAGSRYMGLIHELPCVVHWGCYGTLRNCDEAHHLEFDRGPHSDFATVPTCEECHHGLHKAHRRAFYRAHKLDDVKLLAWTNQLKELAEQGKIPLLSDQPA